MKKIFATAMLLVILCAWSAFSADNDKEDAKRLITVSGTDFVEALPDTAYFNFSVSVEKDSPEEAAQVGQELKKNIVQAIAANEIAKKDILQDASSFSERYDYDNKKTIYLFNYSTRLRLTDFAKIAWLRKTLINEKTFEPVKASWLSRRGLNVQQDTTYELVVSKNSIEREALRKAYENAVAKVQTLAEASAVKWTVFRVTESGAQYQPVYAPERKSFAVMGAVRDNAEANDEETIPTLQRITAQVTVEAEIL
jgi:uncharacterized protein YggE